MWYMFKVIRSNKPEIEMCQSLDVYSVHLETSSDLQINAYLQEIRVTESNDDVRILTGSSEVAVFACAQ